MRVGIVEWPEGLDPDSGAWTRICLVTNELPFGSQISASERRSRTPRRKQGLIFISQGQRHLPLSGSVS